MGINHLPSLNNYWSRDPRFRYSPVADLISRNRFPEPSRYLHFVDNDTLVPQGADGHDCLGKVRPFIDHLSTKFAEVYREVSVNESMIKFQGRSSLRQYMPLKPTKMWHQKFGLLLTVQMGTSHAVKVRKAMRKGCENAHL